MSTLSSVFHSAESQARAVEVQWNQLYSTLSGIVALESDRQYLDQLHERMKTGLGQFLNEITQPTVIFATTGTTSSGKSAMVNLLAGSEIMPRAVQEMSAGVVRIFHDELARTLEIKTTPHAAWICGTFPNQSDEQIRDTLRDCMDKYRASVGFQIRPQSPQATVHYPVRALTHSNLLQLPTGVRFQVMDLPGLKYVGDSTNSEVIKNCRDALCLVLYDARQTDPGIKANLLDQVVQQVKELGGSPARMLFVFNRIDEFLQNGNRAKEDAENSRQEAEASIISKLREELGEYKSHIDEIRLVPLSAYPALLAWQMMNSPEEEARIVAGDMQDRFIGMIPRDVRRKLAGLAQDWTLDQIREVGGILWKASYADTLFEALGKHVHRHLPDLILPQAKFRFKQNIGTEAVQWALQKCAAELNSSEEHYAIEKHRLENIRTEITSFIESADRQLRDPLVRLRDQCREVANDSIVALGLCIQELASHYRDQELAIREPLVGWTTTFERKVNAILDPVCNSFSNKNVSFADSAIADLDERAVSNLRESCNKLIKHGYSGDNARHGWEFLTREEGYFNLVCEDFRSFREALGNVVSLNVNRASRAEVDRINSALQLLFGTHLLFIDQKLHDLAGDLGLKVSGEELVLEPKYFSFYYNFNINESTAVNTKYDIIHGTRQETRYFLWFIPYNVDVATREDRPYQEYKAHIEKVERLNEMFNAQRREVESEVVIPEFITWILSQLDQLKHAVESSQTKALNSYEALLDSAHSERFALHKKTTDEWVNAKTVAKEFEVVAQKLGKDV